MTNREKFEEVFNLEIDDFPVNICHIVNHSVCNGNGRMLLTLVGGEFV